MTAHDTQVGGSPERGRDAPEGTELLSLFGDEYACDILRALADGPMPARALVEATGMSRPTVYRRLDRLTDAGLVEERLQLSPDGHHRTEFRLVARAVAFDVAPDGVDGRVRAARPADD